MQIPSECRGSMWKWVGDFLSLLLLLPSLTRLISCYPLPGSVLACIMVPKFIFEAPQRGCFFCFQANEISIPFAQMHSLPCQQHACFGCVCACAQLSGIIIWWYSFFPHQHWLKLMRKQTSKSIHWYQNTHWRLDWMHLFGEERLVKAIFSATSSKMQSLTCERKQRLELLPRSTAALHPGRAIVTGRISKRKLPLSRHW